MRTEHSADTIWRLIKAERNGTMDSLRADLLSVRHFDEVRSNLIEDDRKSTLEMLASMGVANYLGEPRQAVIPTRSFL